MFGLLRRNGRRTMETINETNAATLRGRPWHKGKLIGPKPPFQPKHVWAIRTRLQLAGRTRDLALFNLAIDSKLRGCDVVSLRVDDVAPHGYAVDRATVRQNNRPSGQVRDHRADATGNRRAPCCDPEASWRFSVPWPRLQESLPLYTPVCPPVVGVDRQHRSRPIAIRHSLAASNQGDPDL